MAEASAAGPPPESRWWQRHKRWALPAGALVLAAVSFTTVALASPDEGAGGAHGRVTRIGISMADCGGGWADPRPGTQVFELHSTMDRETDVHLMNARSGVVYGEIDGLAPDTARRMTASLGDGTYRFRCLPDDADAILGPVVHITGARHPSRSGAVPVNEHDLIPPTLAYQKWIGGRMSELVRATDRLRSAVHAGDLAAARSSWLTAHLGYERMGAAYGTFGAADQAINGTDAGLAGGVHDPGFTGFHRLEWGLWHGQSAARLKPVADRLAKDVHALRSSWSTERMDPTDMGLRAHEILENTLQFELTGRTDYGSGSNLATARANLDGTEEVLTRLRPLLRTRYPQLSRLDDALHRFGDLLDAQRHGARWTPLRDLSRTQREKIDAAAGDVLERLADIAAICDVRRTA
jgi:iron uptake system component EfeO